MLAAMTRRTPRADALTCEVVELLGEVVRRYHDDYDRAAADYALTGAQARVLALLAYGPTPMRRLADRLKCEPSNVTGIVDRLVARGLVERRADEADRRVKLAAATAEGLRTATELRDSLGDFAREPLGRLAETDRRALRDLLHRMLDGGTEPAAL
ncbi:winged helix-turn-helix transcriptional regulator [Streptomyces sp. JJ66]|nr:winged helix-turn-helix transcriptional regulator [Streptomyces sp. JJ66]